MATRLLIVKKLSLRLCPDWGRGKAGLQVRSGLTLVELMVVIVVSTMVAAVAFSMFQVNSRYYVRQDALLEQVQNLRVAMYTIGRDVRMAGNGFGIVGHGVDAIQAYVPKIVFDKDGNWEHTYGWFEHIEGGDVKGIMRIFAVDGGTSNPDRLTVFRADPELGMEIGVLSESFTAGSDRLLKLQTALREHSVQAGDILVLVNGADESEAIFLEMAEPFSKDKTTISIGPEYDVPGEDAREARFYPKNVHSRLQSFPSGSRIYNMRVINLVTYFVDTKNNRLMADYFDSQIDHYDADGAVIVATDIEDFQVRFEFDNSPGTWQDGGLVIENFANNRVKSMEIGLVARSTMKDSGNSSQPVKLFNRIQERPADGYPRRVLTEVIALRN